VTIAMRISRCCTWKGTSRAVLAVALLLNGGRAVPAQEGPVQDHESIKATAQAYLEAQTAGYANPPQVSVGRIDPRLRLRVCEYPLEAFLPQAGRLLGHVTVGVRCDGKKPWTLYLQAEVKVMAPVVVTTRPLSRGEIVGPGDIDLQEQDLARLTTGYFEDPSEVLGRSIRWGIRAGIAVAPNMIESPRVIRRGERVAILAEGARVEVRMEGEALADGSEGEIIRVRNLSSKRIIEAEVAAPGVVRVRF